MPFYLGTPMKRVVAPTSAERAKGMQLLHELLEAHLQAVEVVVPMGKNAKLGWAAYCENHPNNHKVTVPTWHPSGQGLNSVAKWQDAATALRHVARLVAEESTLRDRA